MSSDTTDDPTLQASATIADRYRVQRRLGGGGMADVYLAEDSRLGRLVAVKVLKPQFAQDAEFVERFRVEAQATALLGHPNIVAVYDRGVDGPPWYIAMEYVPGETLKQRLRREGAMAPEEAARTAQAVLAALQAAHARHIVHRDVTSSNVLVDPAGRVKVADFGIARIGVSALTRTGTMLGTSSYLSPEQAQGRGADERSDLYSLGVVLFEMLTGRVPFVADSDVAVALKHVSETAPDPRTLRPDVPPALAAVVLKALAKEPERRYQSAAELAAALAAAVPGAGQAGPIAAGAEALLPATEPGPARAAAGPSQRRAAGEPPAPEAPGAAVRGSESSPRGGLTARTVYKAATPSAPASEALAVQAGMAATRVVPEPATTVVPRRRRRRSWIAAALILTAAAAAGVWALSAFVIDGGIHVPDVVGRPEAKALVSLKREGLRPTIHRQYSDRYDEGLVSRQLPRAGEQVADDARVDVWVSRGPLHIPAPDLKGLSASRAASRLDKDALAGVSHRSATTKVPAGEVYRQRPAAGETVARGEVVEYWVSTGPPSVKVPDVVGLSSGDASAALEARGLVVSVDYVAGFGEIPGDVVAQDPGPGTKLRKGDEVIIQVAVF